MVCACITTITLIYGVQKLNFGIRLEYCIECAYNIGWECEYSQPVDVTCIIAEQLNWSHTQLVCTWIRHVHSMYVTNIKEK